MTYAPRILVVEDEPAVRTLFTRILEQDGYFVRDAATTRAARHAIEFSQFELAIVDLSLPDGDGLELIRHLRAEQPYLLILAISGFMAGGMDSVALAAGANATLFKPTSPRNFRDVVYKLLDPKQAWNGSVRA